MGSLLGGGGRSSEVVGLGYASSGREGGGSWLLGLVGEDGTLSAG
jgi:hypothetical protein